MPSVVAVCTSKKKGTKKQPVAEIIIKEDFGVMGDAHADCLTHRQVSLLAMESINKMRSQGFDLKPGDFAENITTQEIDLPSLPVGTRIKVGDEVTLEITQIGKECHTACAIRRQVGECIMPTEGVFAKAIRGGTIKASDMIIFNDKPDDAQPLEGNNGE
ncbi:MOSC domain-containing protein [Chloroflexota bacterium]